ncbi:unnamed protein product, partial [Vitis vinifera]|uniref:Uncharacterized protein n=1 Tax=Vitis vinifera TaxID=29760 RepID=D7SLI8_VITVI
MRQNLILDSAIYLPHVEEYKLMKAGLSNWQKACFMPTKSDAHIIAFRAWLRKHSAGPCPQLLPESSHITNALNGLYCFR